MTTTGVRTIGAAVAVVLAVSGLLSSSTADTSSISEHQALDACHRAVEARLYRPSSADFGVSWITHQHGEWGIGANFTADNHAGDIADARFGCVVEPDGKVTVDIDEGLQ